MSVMQETLAVSKQYDLEERALRFAQRARALVQKLPKTMSNFEDGKQLIRSSGSIGANYIEANEALSKKDRVMRMRIARKEAKESEHWLRLLDVQGNESLERERQDLMTEAQAIRRILSAIIQKLS